MFRYFDFWYIRKKHHRFYIYSTNTSKETLREKKHFSLNSNKKGWRVHPLYANQKTKGINGTFWKKRETKIVESLSRQQEVKLKNVHIYV